MWSIYTKISMSYQETVLHNSQTEFDLFLQLLLPLLCKIFIVSSLCNNLPSDIRSTFEGPRVWLIGSASEDYL